MSKGSTVFVGNLPYEASEDEVRAILAQAGPIASFRLVFDKETRQPKGYGFCDYADAESAVNAIKTLSDAEFSGRRLRLDLADNVFRSRTMGKGGGAMLALPPPDTASRAAIKALTGPSLPALTDGRAGAPPTGVAGVSAPTFTSALPIPSRLAATGGVAGADVSPEATIAAVNAHIEIAQKVAGMSQAHLQLCLGALQRLALEAPEGTRAMLQEHPQLCYALLHAQFMLGLHLDAELPPAPEEIHRLATEAALRAGRPPPLPPGGLIAAPVTVMGAPGMGMMGAAPVPMMAPRPLGPTGCPMAMGPMMTGAPMMMPAQMSHMGLGGQAMPGTIPAYGMR